MYKVDFDSFFIQLQCPFLYHASVETYLTNSLGNSSILTTVNLRKSSAFGSSVQVSFSWSAESQMDKILCLFKINTEILIISTIIERLWLKSSASNSIQVASPSPPINLFKTHSLLSISQHCMSGARFQNPHNEKVSFTNLILLLFFKSINVKNCINYLIHEDLSY